MNFGGGYLDIVIFIAITAFLLYRLRSVLGTKSEDEPAPFQNPFEKPEVAEQSASETETISTQTIGKSVPNWASALPNFEWVTTATVHQSLVPLVSIDPQFHPADFLDKAQRAFVMILKAYAEGNRNTLEMLVEPNLYKTFLTQIENRDEKKETYHVVLHSIKKIILSAIKLEGTVAEIAVDIIAEESITHKDENGDVIGDGDGQKRITKDRWRFTRDMRSPDPIWRLSKTEELED